MKNQENNVLNEAILSATTATNQDLKTIMSIKDRVNLQTPIITAFEIAKEFQDWSDNTEKNYSNHIKSYTSFLIGHNIIPILEHITPEICMAWKKHLSKRLREKYKTIKNRVAALKSIISFYCNVGVMHYNPFAAIKIKVNDNEHHSRHLSIQEQNLVYLAVEKLKREGFDIEVNVKFALATAARVVTLNSIQVKHIHWDKKTIEYCESKSSKNHLFMPIGSSLMALLESHVERYNLTSEDFLLRNLKGEPLENKQFNYMIKRLCEYLGWENEKLFSPHGFRYTLATRLDNLGAKTSLIRLALSHNERTDRGNAAIYICNKPQLVEQLRYYVNSFDKEFETFASQNRYLLELPTIKDVMNVLENQNQVNQSTLLPNIDSQTALRVIQLLQHNPQLLNLNNLMQQI